MRYSFLMQRYTWESYLTVNCTCPFHHWLFEILTQRFIFNANEKAIFVNHQLYRHVIQIAQL